MLTNCCSVSCHLRSMPCFRGAPLTPRLDPFGVGLSSPKRGLNKNSVECGRAELRRI